MDPSIEELAQVFDLAPAEADRPARFAKVTAVSGDTVTVALGSGTADAVRCCPCIVGDVVLLETLPSGQLAAAATKGYNGGGGGTSPENLSYYGTCTTGAATAAKVVTCPGFVLADGARISVLFKYVQQTVAAPTLNVNGTGAIAVWKDGEVTSNSNALIFPTANMTAYFIYDGSNWVYEGADSVLLGPKNMPSDMNMNSRGGVFQHYTPAKTVTNGAGDYGHYLHMTKNDRTYYTSQLFIPSVSTIAPAWRTNGSNSTWTAWDSFYTAAHPIIATASTVGGVKPDGSSIIIDAAGTISATASATCAESSDGAAWSYYLTTAVGDWVGHNRGWKEEKYSDGRLVVYFWDWVGLVSGSPGLTRDITENFAPSSGDPGYGTMTQPTAFVDTPTWHVDVLAKPYNVTTWPQVSITVTDMVVNTSVSFRAVATSNCRAAFCIRMEGHWA